MVERADVYLVNLDPAVGAEIKKTRPALVVSPAEMNRHLSTVIVAPMTTRRHGYPTRIRCSLAGKTGEVVLDQIRTVDRARLVRRIGRLRQPTMDRVLAGLREMFEP